MMAVVQWVLAFLALASAGNAQEVPLARIAFGSCAHQDKPQPIWEAVLDYGPE
jgi:alkaline phosphatase D